MKRNICSMSIVTYTATVVLSLCSKAVCFHHHRRQHVSIPFSLLIRKSTDCAHIICHRRPSVRSFCASHVRNASDKFYEVNNEHRPPDPARVKQRGKDDLRDDPLVLARKAISILSTKSKTSKRLEHMLELALLPNNEDSGDSCVNVNGKADDIRTTIADIGTDHGLLPIGLAISGKFEKVVGVDVSMEALRRGAMTLLQQNNETFCNYFLISEETVTAAAAVAVTATTTRKSTNADIQKTVATATPRQSHPTVEVGFRCGNGLACLKPGEADTLCIAGMGVNTILKILSQTNENSDIDRLGWHLVQERIVYIAPRWYISVSFEKRNVHRSSNDQQQQQPPRDYKTVSNFELPGSRLLATLDDSNLMKATFDSYVQHHLSWLEADKKAAGFLGDAETRWLQQFSS